MSKARTIDDYYATVSLHRYHKDNPSKTGERIEIVVRIPEEAAKILFGSGRRPAMISHKVYRRAARIARQTVGMPQEPWAIEGISVVESKNALRSSRNVRVSRYGWIGRLGLFGDLRCPETTTHLNSITLLSNFLLRGVFFCKMERRGVGRSTLATEH